jgi:hypothetical protein
VQAFISATMSQYANNPNVVYDEAAAGTCIDAYRTVLSACTNRDLSKQLNTACDNIFRGTVPLGGSCGTTTECAKPATGGVSCTTAVCTVTPSYSSPTSEPHAVAGQACTETCSATGASGSICGGYSAPDGGAAAYCWTNDGLACSSAKICEAAPGVGQTCIDMSYCATDAYCLNGKCVASQATGPCPSGRECLSTSYCDYTTKQCTPLKQNGEACNQGSECLAGQCEQDHCRNWSVATLSSCAGLLD